MFRWQPFLLLLFCLPLVYSLDTPVYKAREVANIKVPCLNNESYCSPSAVCSITILDGLDNVLVNNQNMTNSNSYFNYSFSNTNNSGVYKAQIVCSDGGENGYSLFNFKITENGKDNTTNLVMPMIATIFIIVFLSVFGFIIQKQHGAVGLPMIILSFILLLFLAVQGRLMLDMNANVDKIVDQMNFFYTFLMWIVGAITVYITVFILIKWKDWMLEQKLLKQGLKR
jgi:hypothetical protein